MKKIVFLLLLLVPAATVFSQKVQLKKDKILIDKVEKYTFKKTKKGNLFGKIPHYELRDLDNKLILSLTDTAFTYVQLPNELGLRVGYRCVLLQSSQIDEIGMMNQMNAFNVPKYIVKTLEDLGFFKTNTMTNEILEGLLATQDRESMWSKIKTVEEVNEKRMANHKYSASVFGPLLERKPTGPNVDVNSLVLKEDKVELGKYVKRFNPGGIDYTLINSHGKEVGKVLFNADYTVGTLSVQTYKKEFHWKKVDKDHTVKVDSRLEKVTKEIFALGFL